MPEPETPTEGNPEPQTPATPSEASGEQGQQPDLSEAFSDTFDPASLPDELRPAYKQMRDAFSQKTQTLAEERRAIQEQLEARQGPQQQEYEEYEDDDDADPYEQRLAALEQALMAQAQSAQQQAEEQAEINHIVDSLQKLTAKTGRDFAPEELDAIGTMAESIRDESGNPDVDAAYELIYSTVLGKERERWKAQKSSPQAPRGSAATEVPDLDTPQGRRDYMAQQFAARAQE